MSHLSQGFTGFWHLMTFPESQPLQVPVAAALAEMAKSPGDLSKAIVLGTQVFTELLRSHADMLPEDRAIIPTIWQHALDRLKAEGDDKAYAVAEIAVKTALLAAS